MSFHLPILAVAFGIYIFGVSAVLYFRPQLMFKPSGTWKEFGVGRGEERTVVPFWLFAVFWAFISYGTALVIMSQFANMALNAFPEQAASTSIPMPSMPMSAMQMPSMSAPTPLPNQMPATPSFIRPVSSSFGINPGNPGYYVLQNMSSGPPQYVYYGPNPPN